MTTNRDTVDAILRQSLGSNENRPPAPAGGGIVINGPVTINVYQAEPATVKKENTRVPLDGQALTSSRRNASILASLPPAKLG